MEDFYTKIQKEARQIRLSPEEKQHMRVSLYEAIKNSPIVFAAPTASSVHVVKSPYFFFSPKMAMPVAALLVVMLGGGTAFAAQGSLPGDPLYSIKLSVNETLEGTLVLSPEAKAQWHADIAERRLEEAETLASQNKLTAAASEQLSANFDTHAKEAQDLATHIENKDPEAAAQISAQFDSSLSAHTHILAQISNDSNDEQTKADSNKIAARIRSYERPSVTQAVAVAPQASDSKARTFAAVSTESTSSTSTVVSTVAPTTSTSSKSKNKSSDKTNATTDAMIRLQGKAGDAFANVKRDFAKISSSLGSSTKAQINIQIEAISTLIEKGSFTEALKESTQLDAYLKAGKKFAKNNNKLLQSLLGVSEDISTSTSESKPQTNKKSEKSDSPKKEDEASSTTNTNAEHDSSESHASSTLQVELHL